MDRNKHPKRAFLQGDRKAEMFEIMCKDASEEQWAEWLRAPLEHAAARGNMDLVGTLISAGANGSSGGSKGIGGRTLLDAAVQGGNEAVVSALLQAGSGPDVKVTSGTSPLHAAIVAGHVAVARKLLAAGADADYTGGHCYSPLHAALFGGQTGLVNDLLIAGANPNVVDQTDSTPLHIAASKGYEQIASALLCNGRTEKDPLDWWGKTPLMVAVENGHASTVKVLLVGGANMTGLGVRQEEPYTALEEAAQLGEIDVIKAFLQHEPSVRVHSDRDGYTPLSAATLYDKDQSVDVLVDGGFDVNAVTTEGWSPLHYAAHAGSHKCLIALLRRGADPSKASSDLQTPLHHVCSRQKAGVAEAVDLLLRHGASESAIDRNGRTPADALDHPPQAHGPPIELQLVRDLLANAPADRVWRRRGWLVMLRARAEREAAARSAEMNGVHDVAEEASGSGKVARTDGGAGGGGGGISAVEESFGSVVAVLVGVKARDVFRAVVSFL